MQSNKVNVGTATSEQQSSGKHTTMKLN